MNIDVQQTPNPDTLKFVLSLELVQNGSIEFKNSAEANEYPFVQKIFQLGAELVFFGNNFISVKKNSGTQWNEISEEIQDIIKMGDKVDEIIKFLKEDKTIRSLVLASSIENDNPGPIIKSLSKKMNDLPVPLVIIPGLISEKELDNLI